jgi:type II secretory pathway pseudopilin PulG
MTLLEALLAVVILGLSAVGYLQVFQGSAQSVRAAEEWNRAGAVAESYMERELLSLRDGGAPPAPASTDGITAKVQVTPWRGRLRDVTVVVSLPDGRSLTAHRLVRSP